MLIRRKSAVLPWYGLCVCSEPPTTDMVEFPDNWREYLPRAHIAEITTLVDLRFMIRVNNVSLGGIL